MIAHERSLCWWEELPFGRWSHQSVTPPPGWAARGWWGNASGTRPRRGRRASRRRRQIRIPAGWRVRSTRAAATPARCSEHEDSTHTSIQAHLRRAHTSTCPRAKHLRSLNKNTNTGNKIHPSCALRKSWNSSILPYFWYIFLPERISNMYLHVPPFHPLQSQHEFL